MRRTDILNLLFEQAELTGARSFFQRKRREDLSLAECLEPHRLDAILSNYGRRFGTNASRIAVAGEWSKRYFFFVARPMIAATIMADWCVSLAPESVGLNVTDDGDIIGLRLSSFGRLHRATSSEERFDFIVRDNLAPVVEAIVEVSSLSRNVLWSNAGNLFEGTVRGCKAQLQSPTPGLTHAFDFLDLPTLADGARNPLFRPIVYPVKNGEPKRLRRVCCIRYLLETLDYCATCPCPRGQ